MPESKDSGGGREAVPAEEGALMTCLPPLRSGEAALPRLRRSLARRGCASCGARVYRRRSRERAGGGQAKGGPRR
jgi:hypothetical protein